MQSVSDTIQLFNVVYRAVSENLDKFLERGAAFITDVLKENGVGVKDVQIGGEHLVVGGLLFTKVGTWVVEVGRFLATVEFYVAVVDGGVKLRMEVV